MTNNLKELAAKPADEDQLARAQEIVGTSADLQHRLDSFLASHPTRGAMNDFLASLRTLSAEEQIAMKISSICRVAGIDEPNGAERLMAMQIGLMQEQNSILESGLTRTLNQMRSDANTTNSSGPFTSLLGGLMLGAVLTR